MRRTAELFASAPRVCTASISGRPARMNAPSCRDRCMTASRSTRGAVSSAWRMLFFSVIRILRSSRSYRASSAASRLSAFSTPFANCPVALIATYEYLAMSSPYDVDGSENLGQIRHAALHQADCLFLERAHSLGAGQLAQLVVRRTIEDQLADRVRHGHQLVHTDALQVAGVPAEVAAGAAHEAAIGYPSAHRVQEGELLRGLLVVLAAVVAD